MTKLTIHHATAKKAAALGIDLRVDDFNGDAMIRATSAHVSVLWADAPGAVVAHQKVADVLTNNPDLIFQQFEDEDGELQYRLDDKGGCRAREYDLDAAITTTLENIANDVWVDGDTGEEIEADEEEEDKGSVVSNVYKVRYKERGRKQDCGDWLALQLEDLTRVAVAEDGKSSEVIDMDRLYTILDANDVSFRKYLDNNAFNRGWQGRFRMTTRMILAKRVADKGFLFVPGELTKDGADQERKTPKAWCEANATKVKEDKPKRAKKAAPKAKAAEA